MKNDFGYFLKKKKKLDEVKRISKPVEDLGSWCKIKDFVGLPKLQNLKILNINGTNVSSFLGAQLQPSLKRFSCQNTPLENNGFVPLMAKIAFGLNVDYVNGSEIGVEIHQHAFEIFNDLRPLLIKGWIIISDNPFRIFNVETHKRKMFFANKLECDSQLVKDLMDEDQKEEQKIKEKEENERLIRKQIRYDMYMVVLRRIKERERKESSDNFSKFKSSKASSISEAKISPKIGKRYTERGNLNDIEVSDTDYFELQNESEDDINMINVSQIRKHSDQFCSASDLFGKEESPNKDVENEMKIELSNNLKLNKTKKIDYLSDSQSDQSFRAEDIDQFSSNSISFQNLRFNEQFSSDDLTQTHVSNLSGKDLLFNESSDYFDVTKI